MRSFSWRHPTICSRASRRDEPDSASRWVWVWPERAIITESAERARKMVSDMENASRHSPPRIYLSWFLNSSTLISPFISAQARNSRPPPILPTQSYLERGVYLDISHSNVIDQSLEDLRSRASSRHALDKIRDHKLVVDPPPRVEESCSPPVALACG